MLTILISILFTTLVFAAPPSQIDNAPWKGLKDDSTLARFQATLLNQTVVTFLNECYPPQLSTTKLRISCSRYFDAVLQLNSTDFIVDLPTVMKLLKEPSKDANFCKQNHTFPAMNYYKTKPTDFSDSIVCGYMCMDEIDDVFVPKPICVFLAWMGEQIKIAHKTESKPVELPKLTQNVLDSNKSVQPILGLGNTGTSADKQITANSTIKTPETNQNVTVTVKPQIVQQAQVDEKKPEVINKLLPIDTSIDLPEEKPNNQEPAPEPAAKPEPEAAAGVVPEIPEPEKKEQVAQSNAPLGTEITDEDGKTKDTANDKQDSFGIDQQLNEDQQNLNDSEFDDGNPEDGDEDDDHDALLQNKLSKGIATADPEKPSSVEIIDSNYLPKVNHVTDPFLEQSGSNFFTYFFFGMFLCIVMYVVYHNKSKILALLLEGRRSDKGRGGRRKHTAAYRKLDSNLEEAITSSASGRITQIIY